LLDEIAARMAPSSPRKINNAAGWFAWANKELRGDGIYPITNLGIKHRQLHGSENSNDSRPMKPISRPYRNKVLT
jgi:hypothetical protein